MDSYDEKSCSALEKPHYKPIEAALRWCNLTQHESAILLKTGKELLPSITAFPQWPCLRTNAEKVYEAIQNGELVGCRDGRQVPAGDHVTKERLTIRHTDLKAWMSKYYPDQKPAFLFDDVERTTHAAINADSYRALQVDRDALKAKLDATTEECNKLKQDLNTITGDRDSLAAMVAKANVPGARAETTYLNIIGALLKQLTVDKAKANDTTVITQAVIDYGANQGISERKLQETFAAAKRSLGAS